MIHINPLYQLIAQGEHQQQDFKFCINDSRKIARSLVAFANTDGGRLLVGVKDNGKIAGVKSDEEFYMVEAAAHIYSSPQINFEVVEWEAEGKMVLEIIVQPSSLRPHYAENDEKKWIAYIRKADENIRANNVQLKAWKLERSERGLMFTYDEPRRQLVNYLQHNEKITLTRFTKIARISRFLAETILAEFLSMGCIIIEPEFKPVLYSLNNRFDVKGFE